MLRVVKANPLLVTALAAITLVCLVHAAFGLFIILSLDALCCHSALCRYVITLILLDFDGNGAQSHALAVLLLRVVFISFFLSFFLLLLSLLVDR